MSVAENVVLRIERAVKLMARRVELGEVSSLDDLAEAASLSKFHFHRVYRLVTGETCSQTLARLRLAKGLDVARMRDASITEAALAAGYGSGQSFAKLVRQHLNSSASELCREPERLSAVIAELSAGRTVLAGDEVPLRIQIANLEPFEVVAVRTKARYPAVASTYIKLFEEIGGAENVRAIIGIPHGNSEHGLGGELIFDCGFLLRGPYPEVSRHHIRIALTNGPCLCARHIGSYAQLPKTLDALYRAVLLSEGVTFDDRACVFHYLDDPERTPQSALRTDLYVPITVS